MTDATATALVLARATREHDVVGIHCEVCGTPVHGERGIHWALHHRRFRDGRPDSHTPQNTLVVHGADNQSSCHGVIHRDKTAAMENGWAITRHGDADPLTVPVLIDGGSRLVWLTADGRYSDDPPGVAA